MSLAETLILFQHFVTLNQVSSLGVEFPITEMILNQETLKSMSKCTLQIQLERDKDSYFRAIITQE